MPFKLPAAKINWTNSIFLSGIALASLTVVPYHIWSQGIDLFQIVLFFCFFIATGLSITLGYHRLFAHKAFKAKWPVRLATLLFGAATFENCVLAWTSDHRRHHKHVDHEEDPYDISKGFWYAHIGWILFKKAPEPPWDNVLDLKKDKLVMFQSNYYLPIALIVSFGLPAAIGWLWAGASGALTAFLVSGVLRILAVQQMTFFINSLCHTLGNRPYSSNCSARDSWFMAFFTFGEGYHNYHHEFQHDYRNGVKWWQWDPTKWTIWTLEKLGMASDLRRVSDEKIIAAQLNEARRRVKNALANTALNLSDKREEMMRAAEVRLDELAERWGELKDHYSSRAEELRSSAAELTEEKIEAAREAFDEIRREVRATLSLLDEIPAAA
ncbi:MAG: acyl-CoA desaturase [Opitutaceae bacterium]|nr:acyl-CoA desaturase [Opitutaceae bacterium]